LSRQARDHSLDAALPGLRLLGTLNGLDVLTLMGVGQPVPPVADPGLVDGGGKIGGRRDDARPARTVTTTGGFAFPNNARTS